METTSSSTRLRIARKAAGAAALLFALGFVGTAFAAGGPTISNVATSGTNASSTTVMWSTDVAANSVVNYGTSTNYTLTKSGATSTMSHSVILDNLLAGTTYHFSVSSTAASGTATSSSGTASSSDQTFTTTAASSSATSTPLAIDGATAVRTSATADNVFDDGWEWVIHFTVPDNENAFRIRFSDWGNASNSFPAANDIRISSAQSSNASTPSSGVVESGNGYSGWLYLNGDTASSTAGRQIDLTVEVRVPFGTPTGSYSSTFTAQSFPSSATSTAQ
jgi:hypothetical protein